MVQQGGEVRECRSHISMNPHTEPFLNKECGKIEFMALKKLKTLKVASSAVVSQGTKVLSAKKFCAFFFKYMYDANCIFFFFFLLATQI